MCFSIADNKTSDAVVFVITCVNRNEKVIITFESDIIYSTDV